MNKRKLITRIILMLMLVINVLAIRYFIHMAEEKLPKYQNLVNNITYPAWREYITIDDDVFEAMKFINENSFFYFELGQYWNGYTEEGKINDETCVFGEDTPVNTYYAVAWDWITEFEQDSYPSPYSVDVITYICIHEADPPRGIPADDLRDCWEYYVGEPFPGNHNLLGIKIGDKIVDGEKILMDLGYVRTKYSQEGYVHYETDQILIRLFYEKNLIYKMSVELKGYTYKNVRYYWWSE